jgi:hypothetical protein
VNCPLLDCAAVVLLTGSFAMNNDEDRETVTAVLPRPVARVIAAGRSPGPNLPGNRCLVTMRTPVHPDELIGLEDVVLTAYLSTFPD